MDQKTPSSDLYIPPHRRHKLANPPVFTFHANARQIQRNISSKAIQNTHQTGMKMAHPESITYIDATTQVVTGADGTVITVMDNKRNTNFDLLRNTQSREIQLLKDIKFKKNNDHAMCELAALYLSGDLGNRKVKEAYTLLLSATQVGKGNSHAMCLLSQMHARGDLGIPDLKAASEWMEKAADRNNKYALAIVGQRYLRLYLKMRKDTQVSEAEKTAILEKTKKYLAGSANKGSTRAMWTIGLIHEEGYQGEKNLPKAIETYTQAAKLGSPASLSSLNRLTQQGELSEEAFEIILDEASRLIATTSSELAVEIGLQQIKGTLGKNPQRGFYLLEKSAEQRNQNAIRTLATLYRNGKYCPIDLLKSQYWFAQLKTLYEKATQEGNVNAMLDLANLFLNGNLGKIDLGNAEALFLTAANTGDIECMLHIGRLYIEGRLGDKNPSEGLPWINTAIKLWSEKALKGDIEASLSLSDIYLDKELGFKDYTKAFEWLSLAAEKGSIEAIFELADMCLAKKVPYEKTSTIIKALETIMHQIPSELDSKTKRVLGDLYYKNDQYEIAESWYIKAAQLDNSIALYKLGTMYENGVLGEVSILKAIQHYILSACKDNKDAMRCLYKFSDMEGLPIELQNEIKLCISENDSSQENNKGALLYQIGQQCQINNKETTKDPLIAALYFRKAAKKYDHRESAFALGQMYESGELGEKTRPVAINFYKQSAKKEHPESIKALINIYKRGFLTQSNPAKVQKWQNKEETIKKSKNFIVVNSSAVKK